MLETKTVLFFTQTNVLQSVCLAHYARSISALAQKAIVNYLHLYVLQVTRPICVLRVVRRCHRNKKRQTVGP